MEILDITNYNEVLVCDGTFQMRRLRNNGTFENIPLSFTSDKLMFNCIHTANRNDIIVGFTNTKRNSTGFLERSMIRDTNYASKIRRVDCDCDSDKKIFSFPTKITTDINGDIYVIDQTDFCHRVVSIGKWGQSKWTYSCHQSLNPVSSVAKEKGRKGFREDNDDEEDEDDIITTSSGLVLMSEETKMLFMSFLMMDSSYVIVYQKVE